MDALDAVARWPVGSAAVGVLGPDLTAPPLAVTGPPDEAFPWASVTKLATALAVLVAVEEGTVDLDEPAGPKGSTVRHLLSHSSGLGPEPGSPSVEPGTVRIYSNAGYTLLGELVASRSGMTFGEYLRVGVLEPLGMVDTGLDKGEPAGEAAAGLVGPLTDLLALGRAWAVPTLISGDTHRKATTAHLPGLAGILPGFGRFDPCPWGLGVEIRGQKWPHWTGRDNASSTYGHFGRSGSFLWVDPDAGLVCAGLCDRPFGPWATKVWPALSDDVLAAWDAPG